MTTLTISIEVADAADTRHRMVLASLPNSFRVVDRQAEVVLLSGMDPTRLKQACAEGARAVVIDRPGRLTSEDLRIIVDVADRQGCIVVPAPRYASRAATAGELVGQATVDLVESTIRSGDTLRSCLVEQLALMRALLGPVSAVEVLHGSVSHYVLRATMVRRPQTQVLLNGLASTNGAEEASAHAVGPDRRVTLRIDDGPLARPAELHCFDRDGAHSPWPLHQHAHRLTLAQLHRLLTTGNDGPSYSAAHLLEDVRLARALTT